MESNVPFETEIREQLQGREIAPSPKTWEQLSAILDQGDVQRKRRWRWRSVAAVLVGLLMGGAVYYNLEKFSATEVPVVEAPTSPMLERPVTPIGTETERAVVAVPGRSLRVEGKQEDALKAISGATDAALSVGGEVLALEGTSGEKEALPLAPQELLDEKIGEVLAQVALLEQVGGAVTDAEVDSLLLQAQRELFADRIFMDDHAVDAMALLADVERELDPPFREQLFDLLKEGYFRAKTAVAARNN